MTSTDGQAAFGSDLLVRLLAHLGIEYVALNPGATSVASMTRSSSWTARRPS